MSRLSALFAFLFILLINVSTAQEKIEVVPVEKSISKGNKPGYEVFLYQVSKKDVEKNWMDNIRKETKNKVELISNEYVILGTIIKPITTTPINIYSRLTETSTGVKLDAFFEMGDTFLSKRVDELKDISARKFLYDFAVESYKIGVNKELKAQEDKLKSLEKELEKLIKEQEKQEKSISDNNITITSTKSSIIINEGDQTRKNSEIEGQKDKLAEAKSISPDVAKDAEKTLSEMEKDRKNLIKAQEGMHKKISESESNIRNAEREIERLKSDQASKKSEIESQKSIVMEVKSKLENIK